MGLEERTQDDLYRGVPHWSWYERMLQSARGPSTLFLFTNEAQKFLFKDIDHAGKSVFGIAGGGDYLISALGNGATEAFGVDCSKRSCFHAEMKWSAVKNLGYDEFIAFYSDPSLRAYCKVREDLSDTAKSYFDLNVTAAGRLFEGQRGEISDALPIVDYLRSPAAYAQTQDALRSRPRMKVVWSDMADALPAEPRYDIIYLSNVLDWTMNSEGPERAHAVVDKARASLLPGGLLLTYFRPSLFNGYDLAEREFGDYCDLDVYFSKGTAFSVGK